MRLYQNNWLKSPPIAISLLLTLAALSGCAVFTIGGTVSGLTGSGLVLQNNGEDDLTVSADGSFSFPTELFDTTTYQVEVSTQPSNPSQICTISNGSGTLAGVAVSNIEINCVLEPVVVTVSAKQAKVLSFSWNDVGADHYKLLKNPDGVSGYNQIGENISTTSVDEAISVHLQDWVNASYMVQSCDASGTCADSAVITATTAMLNAIGYFKASNTGASDYFGASVALSADGNTLAVGAYGEDSTATGINGDQSDNTAESSGAVYLFSRTDSNWSQQAYIKASNTNTADFFGHRLTLSADGNTLAVGAYGEDSSARGINGDQSDNTAESSGAVYLFSRTDSNWSQQAYIKASNTDTADFFGHRLTLSTDGNTLVVGAYGEDSSARGINGDQSDNTAASSGAVYLFSRFDSSWSQQAYIKASNTDKVDHFGQSVALSADGNTLAVGAPGEDSAAKGINGNQNNNIPGGSGATYLFKRFDSSWNQQAYIKASNTDESNWFGYSVALSADGNALAVGAIGEDSAATGINGDQIDNTASSAGAAYLFSRTGSNWSQQAYIKASNTDGGDWFGISVALTTDGNSLAVVAIYEDSSVTGINDHQSNNTASSAGAAYLFSRFDGNWSQQAYIKASNTDVYDGFGYSVALSADGTTLAVGATWEDSAATGINGDQSNDSVRGSGAVYLY